VAIIESDKLLHWNYFLSVEEDLHRLARFIELSADNFETYSIELARILFAASAEVDVVAKQLCGQLRKGCDVSNMNGYRDILWQELPVLAEAHVNIPRHGLVLKPWENLRESSSPDWWRAYNEVKHERHERYRSANLKNTLNSIGGLFLLLLFFYREQALLGHLKPNPSMLRLGPPLGDDSLFWDPSKAFVYRLDPNGL
jgi:hypothetical protein